MEMSENVTDLFKGMYALKGKLEQPKFDGKVDYTTKKGERTKFEYATLKAIEESIRKAAQDSESGIDFQQEVTNEDNCLKVRTILTHSSGQYIIHGPFIFPNSGSNPQGLGSLTTYARRYSLSSVFGIAADKDDDGQIANDSQEKPSSSETKNLTLKEARGLKVTFGKHNGLTLGEIAKDNKEYLDWLLQNAKEDMMKKAVYMVLYPDDKKEPKPVNENLITKEQEDEILNLVNVLGQAVGKSPDEVLQAYGANELDKFPRNTADEFIKTLGNAINKHVPTHEEQTDLFDDQKIDTNKNENKSIPWGQKQ
jgi:hypothetical protein